MSKDFEEFESLLREMQQKIQDIHREICKEEEEGKIRVSGICISTPNGSTGSSEAARIINEAKNRGVEIGKVEAITGKSKKPAMRIMRAMAEEFEFLEFRKGDNNKPSMIFHKDYLPTG